MPLPLPNLDTRTWTDLVEEARTIIPRYGRQWTDHNLHDPGITIVELLAWLTELKIFRANRISDRHRLKFLQTLGYSPKRVRAARAVVQINPGPASASGPLPVPKGTIVDAGPFDGAVHFRTLDELTSIP